MLKRSLAAAVLLTAVCGSLAVALQDTDKLKPQPTRTVTPRVLPGIQPDGFVRLPNQWSLKPAGKHLEVGDFPVNIALHPSGEWLAVQHAGYGDHEVVIVQVNGRRQRIVSRVAVEQTFSGICFSPDGKTLFLSGGEFEVIHAFDFDDGLLSKHRELPVVDRKVKFIPSGLAIDKAGKTLFAAGPWGDAVCVCLLTGQARIDLFPLRKIAFLTFACHIPMANICT